MRAERAACADALDEFEIFGEGSQDGLAGDGPHAALDADAGTAGGSAAGYGEEESESEEEEEGEGQEEGGEGVDDEAGSCGEQEDADEQISSV